MNLNNETLKLQVASWCDKNPEFKKIIERSRVIFEIVDANQQFYKNTEKELIDFVHGIVLLNLSVVFENNKTMDYKKYQDNGYELTRNVFSSILNHIQLKGYKDFLSIKQSEEIYKYAETHGIHILTSEEYEHTMVKFIDHKRDIYNNSNKTEEVIKDFIEYLNCKDDLNNKIVNNIKKINPQKPFIIYLILKSLFDNGILIVSTKEVVYKAYFKTFSYQKKYESLKSGLNKYFLEKTDKENKQKIDNMYETLIS